LAKELKGILMEILIPIVLYTGVYPAIEFW